MSISNLININNLSLKFKDKIIFNEVSFSINEGDFIVLKGENGAGKSTLVEYMIGQRYSKAVKRKKGLIISYVPQASAIRGKVKDIFASTVWSFGLSNPTKVINAFSINKLLDKNFDKLSSGEKQRVLLALSFLRKPDIIVLDEFTKGLDKGAKSEFIQLVKNLKKEYKIAFLVVSHNEEVTNDFSSTIWQLENGKIEVQND